MTRAQILALSGRELDAQIGLKITGAKWHRVKGKNMLDSSRVGKPGALISNATSTAIRREERVA